MKTKFGTAKIISGYYRIISKEEGNYYKALHRLIFEDFYQIKLPADIVIHHEDGNKLNNEIWNLVPMTTAEHNTIHHKGFHHSEETKQRISNSLKGEKNPMYGRHHSEETKATLREKNSGANHVFYGKKFKDSHKRKISASRNTTGYRNVCIQPCPSCKQKFRYKYSYYDEGKQKVIQSVSLEKLEERVISKGLPWEKLDEEAVI